MYGLALAPHDSGAMRGRRMIAGGQRGLRHAVPGRTRSHMSQPASEVRRQAPQQNGKPHKPVIVAIARRLITIAHAVLKTATPWQHQTGA